MAKKSVGDIWKELQAATAPRGRVGGLGGLAYTQRAQERPATKGPGSGFIESLQTPAAGRDSDDAVLASLQRDINCLADRDRRLRVKALEAISARLLGSEVAPAPAGPLQAALCGGPLLVPLVRLLADPVERCRELAAGFMGAAVARVPDAGGLLPTLVPALAERMGVPPVEEPSEEIRLLLAQLAGRIVERHAAALLAVQGSGGGTDLLGGVVQVLCRGLEDGFPDIKKVACSSLVQLAAGPCSAEALEPHLDALLSSLLPNLQHQHSRVRLAALEALHVLVLGGMRQRALEERVVPVVQPLAHDHAGSVRAALFVSLAQWLGAAAGGVRPAAAHGMVAVRSRSPAPATLFLPTLLLGLTDELPAVRTDALQQVESVAAAYSEQQAQSPWSSQDGDPLAMELDEEGWPGSSRPVAELPGYSHPFQARPSRTARLMVQAELPRLVPLAVHGSCEWTVALRAEAARLLHALLVYAEAGALQHLPAVLQCLRAGFADTDAGVASHALAAAHVLGVNVTARHWAPFAVEAITAEQLGAAQRGTSLAVLSALLFAAGAAAQPADAGTVQLVAAALQHEELVAAAERAQQGQVQLLDAASNLLAWGGRQCASVAPALLRLLLRLDAAERSRAAAAAAAAAEPPGTGALARAAPGGAATALPGAQQAALAPRDVMARLAAACGLGSAQELCDQLAPSLLPTLCEDHERWHAASPNWQALASLLRCCGGPALAAAAPDILAVLRLLGSSHDRQPELRLAAWVLLEELLRDPCKATAWRDGLAAALAQQVLLPALVWRAGQAAAAVRYAALSALCTMLGGGLLSSEALLELVRSARLLPLLSQCLDEDYMPDTRLAACHTTELLLRSVGCALPAEDVASVQRELLRRLDDSSNANRVAACAALCALLPCLQMGAEQPKQAEQAGQLAAGVLIHMDDGDPAVAEAACGVLEALAAVAPGVVRECAAAAVVAHRNRALVQRVLAACDRA